MLKRLRFALLCATCLYPADAARAEPISVALLTALSIEATATAVAVTTVALSVGVAVGSTLISRALAPKPGDASQTTKGTQASVSIGADVPRNRVYGKQAIAGQLGYWNVYGPDNIFLQLRFTLGAGPHALFGLFANGKRCTLGTPEDFGTPITDFDFFGIHTAWVRFYAGHYDQAIDAGLVDNAVPAGRYADTNVGRGCCYAIVTLGYKAESYPQGVPQFQFEIGALLYDPRKDSSNGGSGAHRWTDQHTWEWSDNPAVGLYEYERGLTIGGHRVIGRGLAPVDILRAYFVDAANICDETVTNKDASTEPRYRIGMNVGADRELKAAEADFCTAFAGSIVESAGAYGPLAGVAQDVVFTFTDDDLIQGKPVRFSQKRPRDQLVNALFGSYSEPAQNYQAVPYAPRTSSADESADGDRFAAQRDYIQILSQTQAQRVGEIDRREGRYQGTGVVTLGFKYSPYRAGDWGRWVSARRGFDKLFRVTQHRLAPDQTITLTLDETANEVFEFDTDVDELNPLAPGDLPGIGVLISTVPDFEVAAQQLNGAGGLTVPSLYCTWSPILDRTVDSVTVRYRVGTDDSTIKVSEPFAPGGGEGRITDGVQASTAYQASAIIATTPPRAVAWTAWVPVTAPSQHVVPTAQNALGLPDLLIEAHHLSHDLDAKVRQIVDQLPALFQQINDTGDDLSAALASQIASVREVQGQHLIALGSRFEESMASIDQVATTLADANHAFADLITTVTARVRDNEASVSEEIVARADGDSALAGEITTLTATVGDNTAAITTEATARADGDSAEAATRLDMVVALYQNGVDYRQDDPPSSPTVGQTWIDTNNDNILSRWNGTAWVQIPYYSIAKAAAQLEDEKIVRADADGVIAGDVSTLSGRVDDAEASIVDEAGLRVTADSALAARIVTLLATGPGGTAEGKFRIVTASTPSGAVASISLEVNVAATGSPSWQPTGLYLDAMSGFGRIRLVANLIELDHPSINGGAPEPLFSVESVDGADRAVFNTDVYMRRLVADVIQAKHIQSGELTKGGSGSVPSSISGNNSPQTVGTFTVNLPDTISGHVMPVVGGGILTAQAGSGSSDINVAAFINGAFAGSVTIRTFGAGTYGPVSIPIFLQVTGTGSSMNLVVDLIQVCPSGYGVLAGSAFGISCTPKV